MIFDKQGIIHSINVIEMKKQLLLTATLASLFLVGCKNETKKMNGLYEKQKAFVERFDSMYLPLYKEAATGYYNASITGKAEDFDSAAASEMRFQSLFNDSAAFAELKGLRQGGAYADSATKRVLELLYYAYAKKQVPLAKLDSIVKLETKVENAFTIFRAKVDGKELTDNEVEDILQKSTKSDEVKAAWMASKKSGEQVASDVVKLVKMRNSMAVELGYANYHQMSLKLDEQDPAAIESLFDELDVLTRDAFAGEKAKIDSFFAKRFAVSVEQLMPWHYQNRFFQEAPELYATDLDAYYTGKDVVVLTREYYKGIGMSIDSIVANSDLYEKPGKNQHAYCMNADAKGDVRMLCNVKPNSYWMGTMLHESGHAVYEKYLDYQMPVAFREPAHTFTTEAVAELFGRMVFNAQWLADMKLIDDAEKARVEENCFKSLRLQMLLFSRWSQVMYRFEKSMYENPEQDLNTLWWNLVERYQLLKRPAGRNLPDWASKIHLATSPCYYHNYLLGELLASQLHHHITVNILASKDLHKQSYHGNPQVGAFFKEKVFAPGRSMYWNEMISNATGEPLTAKFFAEEFVK